MYASYYLSDRFTPPRFGTGGISPSLLSGGLTMAGDLITTVDGADGRVSNFGAITGGMAKGAGTGAAIGSIIPGVGTAIGAGVGALVGGVSSFFANKAKRKVQDQQTALQARQAEQQRQLMADQRQRELETTSRSVLQTYPTDGVLSSPFLMAYGGQIPAQAAAYKAERGEMVWHQPGDMPLTDNRGEVSPRSSTTARIHGDSHSAPSGGVGMMSQAPTRIISDRLTVPAHLLAQLNRL